MTGRRVSVVVAVVLLAVAASALIFAVVPRPPVSVGLDSCSPRALPSRPLAPAGSLLEEANGLALNGRLEAAEALYNKSLEAAPTVPGAGQGLGYVAARREEAARLASIGQTLAASGATRAISCFLTARLLDRANKTAVVTLASADTTPATSTANAWDRFYERWGKPAVRAALPALGLLVIWLLLARVVTSLVVPPVARAWPEWARRTAWWTGLALLVAAASRVTLWMGWRPAWFDEVSTLRWVSVAVGLFLIFAVVVEARAHGERLTWRARTVDLWVAVVGAFVVAAVIGLWILTRPLPEGSWGWVVTVLVGVLGSVLLATGRGHALRLRVEVRKGSDKDGAAAAYVLARLQDLGDSPPRGLKAPDLVDVTDLPAKALESLPTGKLTSALASLVGVLQPSIPWRAVVEECGDDRLVVSLSRNGPVACVGIIDGARYGSGSTAVTEDKSDTATVGSDRGDLLTAVAALILTELAERHRQLTIGLCGAREWESVAAHVVATRPRLPALTVERKAELLGFALERDPRNTLARAAFVQLLGHDARSPAARVAHAERLEQLQKELALPSSPLEAAGWTPLILRLDHSRAAAWLNACIAQLDASLSQPLPAAVAGNGASSPAAAQISWSNANRAKDDLVRRLGTANDPRLEQFVDKLAGIAHELGEILKTLATDAGCLATAVTPAGAPDAPASPSVIFDKACAAAARARHNLSEEGTAIDTLERISAWGPIRAAAREDPFFALLRTGPNATRFRDVVAEPAGSFLDLPVFGDQGSALRTWGVSEPADVIALTEGSSRVTELCEALKVPPTVIGRWRSAALALVSLSNPQAELLCVSGATSGNGAGPTATCDQNGYADWSTVRTRAAALGLGDADLVALRQRLDLGAPS